MQGKLDKLESNLNENQQSNDKRFREIEDYLNNLNNKITELANVPPPVIPTNTGSIDTGAVMALIQKLQQDMMGKVNNKDF